MTTATKKKGMNPRVKKKWLKALRSGQYAQTQGALCHEDEDGNCAFCCLGVLCNIHAEEKGRHWKEPENNKELHQRLDGSVELSYGGRKEFLTGKLKPEFGALPNIVRKWAGLDAVDPLIGADTRASEWNDLENKTFEEIADLVEEYL